jgi:hypothetical protein
MSREHIWKIHDRIKELETTKSLIGLTNEEDLELRFLEVKLMNEWADQNEF